MQHHWLRLSVRVAIFLFATFLIAACAHKQGATGINVTQNEAKHSPLTSLVSFKQISARLNCYRKVIRAGACSFYDPAKIAMQESDLPIIPPDVQTKSILVHEAAIIYRNPRLHNYLRSTWSASRVSLVLWLERSCFTCSHHTRRSPRQFALKPFSFPCHVCSH